LQQSAPAASTTYYAVELYAAESGAISGFSDFRQNHVLRSYNNAGVSDLDHLTVSTAVKAQP
jgi:hypothetical protein